MVQVTYWWNPFSDLSSWAVVEIAQDKFGRVMGYEFQFVYVVYGSRGVCSGVNVNQDE